MRMILVPAVGLLLLALLTAVVLLRRGRGSQDLVAAQLRAMSHPVPGAAPDRLATVDTKTWRRVGELAAAGRRVQAIELLRSLTGCRMSEAKAVVDELSRTGGRSGSPRLPASGELT